MTAIHGEVAEFRETTFGQPSTETRQTKKTNAGGNDGYKEVLFGATAVVPERIEGLCSNPGYGPHDYDICITFPVYKEAGGLKARGEEILKRILSTGAQIYSYYDLTGTYVFVLIRYPELKLAMYADVVRHRMKLDPEQLRKALEAGDPEVGIKPITVGTNHELTHISPYEHIYAHYEYENPSLYWKPDWAVHPFTEHVRLTVTYMILEGAIKNGGAMLQLRNLKLEGDIIDNFPLPNKSKREDLKNLWLRVFFLPHQQPFALIREYFGEKMTLYFHFSAHLANWLFIPACIGLAFECVVISRWRSKTAFSHPVIPFFCVVIAVWSICVTEYWKRRQKYIAMEYGMIGFEHLQQERPQFEGEYRPSVISGLPEKFFPKRAQKFRTALSFTVIGFIVSIAVGIVASIYTLRWYLYSKIAADGAQIIASVINVVQIQLMTLFFNWTAFRLTDMENQRTDTIYEDSMIVKLFCFQFVNNYASFYYLAFVAGSRPIPPGGASNSAGECGFPDCMQALAVNLGITFALRMTLTNFIVWIFPWYNTRQRRIFENKNAGSRPLSNAEEEFIKEPFDNFDGFLLLYSDAATFFGYAVLFTAALPSAPFFAFINKYYGIRFDAHQVLLEYRRPILVGAEDIGNWQPVFEIMAAIGVITNGGLIVFTMTVLDDLGWTPAGKQWIFIGFQWFLFVSQAITRLAINDVPQPVIIQQERQSLYVSKVIDKVPDEELENANSEVQSD